MCPLHLVNLITLEVALKEMYELERECTAEHNMLRQLVLPLKSIKVLAQIDFIVNLIGIFYI